MYIRSSIITVLLATTILNQQQQVEAFPTGLTQFAQMFGGGSGGGEAQGVSAPQAGNQVPNDLGKLITDTLGGGGAPADMEKRFTDDIPTSGSGEVISSGNEKSVSVTQSAVNLIDDISANGGSSALGNSTPLGGATIIKRGGDNKKNNKNKRKNKSKMNNKKDTAPATMATSLRRRGLPGLGGAGGGGGAPGLSSLTGILGGGDGAAAAPGGGATNQPGGFSMALIDKRDEITDSLIGGVTGGSGLLNQLTSGTKLSQPSGQTTGSPSSSPLGVIKRREILGKENVVKQLTGALKLGENPNSAKTGFTKNSSIKVGDTNLPELVRRQAEDLDGVGLKGLVDALAGINNEDPSTYAPQDLYPSSSSPSSVNNAPELKLLNGALGGGNDPSIDTFDPSNRMMMSENGINNSPKLDILKRSVNTLSGADRMARAKQGVVVDSDDHPSQDTMKRDNYPTNNPSQQQQQQQQQQPSIQSFGPPPPNPDYMYAQPPPPGNEKFAQNPSSSSSSSSSPSSSSNEPSGEKEKKKGGGGFKMSLVNVPSFLGRRQLDGLTGGSGSPADGLTDVVSKLTSELNLGNSHSEHTSINRIKQSNPQTSTPTSPYGGDENVQDARLDTPYDDAMTPDDNAMTPDDNAMPMDDEGAPMNGYDMSNDGNFDMSNDGNYDMSNDGNYDMN